ncbi:hypothetical protein LCGC14_1626420 [marine sediment metagenome]|uniref:Uncharacterized protein n=1 Tax=marine sediment metagenome TaxID=412755 RepID=A0A0F9I476_9ZZZZ
MVEVTVDGKKLGFGKIKKIGNRIIITNVKIFKQVCTSAHTSLDTENSKKNLEVHCPLSNL